MSKPEFENNEVLSAAVRMVDKNSEDGMSKKGFECAIIATESAFQP